jgi:hypothetical protein
MTALALALGTGAGVELHTNLYLEDFAVVVWRTRVRPPRRCGLNLRPVLPNRS